MIYTLAIQIIYIILSVLNEIMASPLGDAFKDWYNKHPIEIKKAIKNNQTL